jgi:hypothetical protein
VAALLARQPLGPYLIVRRRPDGAPVVIENAPFLFDGTPMPTRYWLVDPKLRETVSRLEAAGGVKAAEREVDPGALADAHARYAAERDRAIEPDQPGPRPSGGVGGTRIGVKCLHAHLAWWLAGGQDPVGDWVADRISPALAELGLVSGGPGEVVVEGDGPDT